MNLTRFALTPLCLMALALGTQATAQYTTSVNTLHTMSTIGGVTNFPQIEGAQPGQTVVYQSEIRGIRNTDQPVGIVINIPQQARFSGMVTAPERGDITYSLDGVNFSKVPMINGQPAPPNAYTAVRYVMPRALKGETHIIRMLITLY